MADEAKFYEKALEWGSYAPVKTCAISAVKNEMERLCNEGKMTVSHADEAALRLFRAAHGMQ